MLTGRNIGFSDNSNRKSEVSNEVRVTAQELAASFPESTKFDRTPSSLIHLEDEKSFTDNRSDTAFYPIEETATLEPITNDHQTEKAQEENQINKHISDLAKKKLRAEAPFIKMQRLEDYSKQLEKALGQRDEQIENMNQSFRNMQRAYAQKKYEIERKTARAEQIINSKNKLIWAISTASIFVLSISIFFSKSNDIKTTSYDQNLYTTESHSKSQKYLYTVQPNDTLKNIAQNIYGDAEYYKEIMKMNNLSNSKPKPGTKLVLAELED